MRKFKNTLWSGKCPFGKCLSGEMSSRGSDLRGSVSRGFVLEEEPVREVSGRETVLQSFEIVIKADDFGRKAL